jgi:hypothetical protein
MQQVTRLLQYNHSCILYSIRHQHTPREVTDAQKNVPVSANNTIRLALRHFTPKWISVLLVQSPKHTLDAQQPTQHPATKQTTFEQYTNQKGAKPNPKQGARPQAREPSSVDVVVAYLREETRGGHSHRRPDDGVDAALAEELGHPLQRPAAEPVGGEKLERGYRRAQRKGNPGVWLEHVFDLPA